ncbi:MAG: spore cortex biosynthesis protein YabQ [Thermoanaerobacteraceae bacterium]|nr:spore cortex biosynthesis protein YabQ [Thermoanaerobacteraceae bacterium]
MDIKAEVYAFLTMVYCGLIMGILFDIYREKKHYFKKRPVLDAIEDILFWIVQAGVLFLFLYWSNYGEIRMFSTLGVIAGGAAYYYTLSSLVVKILDIIFKTIIKVFSIISITRRKILHIINVAVKRVISIKFFHRNKRN